MAQPPKHEYVPTWSFGNVMTVVALLVPMALGGGGVYVAMRIDSAVADEQIKATQAQVAEVKEVNKVRIDRIESKLDELARNQVAIMIALGVKPNR